MQLWKAVAATLAFMAADIGVTTAIYVLSRPDRGLLEDVRHFNVFDSVLDLWAACLYRSCLLLGAALGVAKNSALGPRRLRASWVAIALVCLLVGIYAVVKLLLFSEVRKPVRDPWFWALFAWTYVSLAASFLLWQLLAAVRPGAKALEPGAGAEAEAEDQPAAPEQASGATLQKLLSYTKPDLAFLVAASFFLIIAALGETFLPYYTGRAIDGIVIQKSMEQFSTAIVVMCLLALGRLNIRLRNCLFRSLVSQETSFFDENRTGDLISRLTSDTTMVSDLVSQNINVFLRNAVKITGVVVFMFSLSWQLSLVTFMGFPIIMMVSDVYEALQGGPERAGPRQHHGRGDHQRHEDRAQLRQRGGGGRGVRAEAAAGVQAQPEGGGRLHLLRLGQRAHAAGGPGQHPLLRRPPRHLGADDQRQPHLLHHLRVRPGGLLGVRGLRLQRPDAGRGGRREGLRVHRPAANHGARREPGPRPRGGPRGLRERDLHLPHAAPHQSPAGRLLQPVPGEGDGAGGALGQREELLRAHPGELLPAGGRPRAAGREAHRRLRPQVPAPRDLPGEPGAGAVRPLHHGEHLLRPAHRALRDGGRGSAEGQRPRLHHGAAGRLQHRDRGEGRPAVRGPEAARGHGPGPGAEAARAHPGRGHQRAGRRERVPDPARHPRRPAAAHGAHHRAPAEHGGAGTPHRGAGQGPCGAAGHPPAAAGPGRPLRQAGAAPDAGAGARPGPRGRPQRGLTARPMPARQRCPRRAGLGAQAPDPEGGRPHPCHCFLLLAWPPWPLWPCGPRGPRPRQPAGLSTWSPRRRHGTSSHQDLTGPAPLGWTVPGQPPGLKKSFSWGVVVGKVTEMF
ncbi:ABC-type oligopeptide transporter ABCB9 isoform X2 [Pipistrellus kuhlii]|uniref:ABC-type oligopeptide transporter ABCB9 isoform X2 n=1 Tax=Pipistrellus kuhlii TaxID=59472 RepID=UPI001E27011A|nr:ABC-type oligopeptide transporter ABCB9 isoform X2 [Pipistrellus kuhlii]